jgi:hypothetical protein
MLYICHVYRTTSFQEDKKNRKIYVKVALFPVYSTSRLPSFPSTLRQDCPLSRLLYVKVAHFPVYNILLLSFCLHFFHLLAWKPNLEKNNIYSNKFFHNFHLSESSFNCPGLQASGLAQRLLTGGSSWNCYLYNR